MFPRDNHRSIFGFLWGVACVLLHVLSSRCDADDNPQMQLAVFNAEITPPLGDGVGVGFMRETLSVEHPLYARGVVLRDAGGTYVLCAVDLCGLCNDSYDLFRKKIAVAAETIPSRVAVQSLHQHTAPVYDANARKLLYPDEPQKLALGLQFADHSAARIANAVRKSRKSFQQVTHIGTSKAKVERVASNRRVPQPDGSLLTRSSSTQDPQLQAAPEGVIDPWLRTVSFYNAGEPIVQLHYFATHPQSFYGDGRVTWDVPGIALERLQQGTGITQIYFTGCGGNVAMGKYNDGTRAVRASLVDRLYDAMARAAKAGGNKQPVTPIRWKTTSVQFPLRSDRPFSVKAQQEILASADSSFGRRLKAAMLMAWIERVQSGGAVEFSSLAIGDVRLLHLPGEPFVQFQLAAQRFAPTKFVAVAGYSECAMWYIGEDGIYTDRGGYEQSWAFSGPCQQLMETTIRDLLSE
ncbi:MAG: hypothetical protein VX346_19445 [Planctomycetota bacterium]|nr:hypothetical protein [Planctomycetota bacterium]